MRKYELMFLLGEDHAEPKAKEIAREINQHLKSLGAQVFHDEFWGKKRLTYPIKGSAFGYYFITQFEAEPAVVSQLTSDFNIDERVIRYLVTDYVEGSEIPALNEQKDKDEEKSDKKSTDKKKTEKGPVKKAKKAEKAEEAKDSAEEEVGDVDTDSDVEVAKKELEEKHAQAESERKEAMEKMINEIVS